jgi:hypothetical protein
LPVFFFFQGYFVGRRIFVHNHLEPNHQGLRKPRAIGRRRELR